MCSILFRLWSEILEQILNVVVLVLFMGYNNMILKLIHGCGYIWLITCTTLLVTTCLNICSTRCFFHNPVDICPFAKAIRNVWVVTQWCPEKWELHVVFSRSSLLRTLFMEAVRVCVCVYMAHVFSSDVASLVRWVSAVLIYTRWSTTTRYSRHSINFAIWFWDIRLRWL